MNINGNKRYDPLAVIRFPQEGTQNMIVYIPLPTGNN